MDTALPQKFPFILDRNFAKGNGTGNRVCTSCDIVVLGLFQSTDNNSVPQNKWENNAHNRVCCIILTVLSNKRVVS